MARGIKIALPGYNALTDTNPNHFSLYVDQQVDYILIKEKLTSTVSVTSSTTIAHNLGYAPFCLVFYESSSGVWRKIHGATSPASSDPYFLVDNTNLTLYNTLGSPIEMTYHIFYDNIT